jgi:hypothetical protein
MNTKRTDARTDVGDYDLRGMDFETLLVGPVTERIIDADRIVRGEWGNGFPNWVMYRCVYAGDSHLMADFRLWCVALAVAYSEAGGVRKPSEALAVCVGRDVCHAMLEGRWGVSSDVIAESLGVAPKTYRRFRNALFARLTASLGEYWVRMQIAMRQVALAERRADVESARGRWTDGRGFGQEADLAGDGCYRAFPKSLN